MWESAMINVFSEKEREGAVNKGICDVWWWEE